MPSLSRSALWLGICEISPTGCPSLGMDSISWLTSRTSRARSSSSRRRNSCSFVGFIICRWLLPWKTATDVEKAPRRLCKATDIITAAANPSIAGAVFAVGWIYAEWTKIARPVLDLVTNGLLARRPGCPISIQLLEGSIAVAHILSFMKGAAIGAGALFLLDPSAVRPDEATSVAICWNWGSIWATKPIGQSSRPDTHGRRSATGR